MLPKGRRFILRQFMRKHGQTLGAPALLQLLADDLIAHRDDQD
jgi:hypothetical protein